MVAGFLSTAALGRSKGIVNSEEWFYLVLKIIGYGSFWAKLIALPLIDVCLCSSKSKCINNCEHTEVLIVLFH